MNAKMVAAGLLVALTGLSAGADERSGGGIFHRDCECILHRLASQFDNAESEPNGGRVRRLMHHRGALCACRIWGREKPFRRISTESVS